MSRRTRPLPPARDIIAQGALLAVIVAAALYVYVNIATNLPRMGLQLGFGFLGEVASFQLGDNPIGYKAGDSYLKAFLAGLANTLKLSLIAIALTTLLGTLVALARLSPNLLVARLAWLYVESMRNIPLLIQLLFWHTFIVRQLPGPRQAWNPLPGVFLSNRGLMVPALRHDPVVDWMLIALAVGLATWWAMLRWARRRRERSGRAPRVGWLGAAIALALPSIAYAVAGAELVLEVPALRGFNFQGGAELTPEFVAMLVGLVLYQGAFAAETIRSGIVGVGRGQVDAAKSLGLTRGQAMRLVVLPQALRIVVPPLTSQYLSLTKNSSLAVAVGYPELFRVSTVVVGDTGRAIECVTIILLVYLGLSLLTAAFMNWFNRAVALKGG